MSIKIAALYKFVEFNDPATIRDTVAEICDRYKVEGMLIVAGEGINGTIACVAENMDKVVAALIAMDARLADMELKFSYADEQPFYHMRVALKKEIVTLGLDNYSAIDKSDKIVEIEAQGWNDVITDPNVLVVDARNDYEVELGTFQNAIDPKTKSFKEFPQFIEAIANTHSDTSTTTENSSERKPRSLAMFCTGGIRCDKAGNFVSQFAAFDKVYLLKGGIVKYLETVGEEDSLFTGECFVFDNRVSVVHGLQRGNCVLCRQCRHPLKRDSLTTTSGSSLSPQPNDTTISDNDSVAYEEGVYCPHCISTLSTARLDSARERQRQITLARERGEKHIGQTYAPHIKKKQRMTRHDNNVDSANRLSVNNSSDS